ncbi:hypothetical protein [Pseudomonas tohonis]|uniref:hypothetical protein n=1 Tax=Pseudomonas tohonis TaxID=2725477 RepID=UPI0021DB413A|nr:hypothetical protein [Pseudomonas tohonis]UXY55131.1 hypothetical protein N9L84_11355 [Pseudomonas tohonis]
MESAAFLLVIAIVVAGYIYGQRRAKREIEKRFSGRERLSLEDVCNLFLREDTHDQNAIGEIIMHVAHELSVDPAFLRPDDRFDKELRPARGWEFDSGVTTLMLDLKDQAIRQGRTLDSSTIKTLDDYVHELLNLTDQTLQPK